jgi:hypothetical protein
MQKKLHCSGAIITELVSRLYQCYASCDTLRDCRKSPKMVILAISHVIKSMTYKHQIHRFRVFRQSLRITQLLQFYRYETGITRILEIQKY